MNGPLCEASTTALTPEFLNYNNVLILISHILHDHSACHKTSILVNDKDKVKKKKTVPSNLSKKQLVILSAALITLSPSVRAGLCLHCSVWG